MDYVWEKNGKNVLELGAHGNYKLYLGSYLDDDVNIVDFHLDELDGGWLWSLVIGICCDNHVTNNWLGCSTNGWGFNCGGKKNHNSGSGVTYYSKDLVQGDLVRMTFDKLSRTLSYNVNGKDLGIAFDNITGNNKRYRIAISCGIELRKLKIRLGEPFERKNAFQNLNEEEKERLFLVMKKFGNIEFVMKNKTIKLWKPFFVFSNIYKLIINNNNNSNLVSSNININNTSTPNININKIERVEMKEIELNLDEEVLLHIFLSKRIKDLKNDNLMDYFLFFKFLEMKDEMIYILEKLINGIFKKYPEKEKKEKKEGKEEKENNKNNDEEEEIFLEYLYLFKEFVVKHENDSIKSWFSDSPKFDEKFSILSFDHSFSLILFEKLKRIYMNSVNTGSMLFKKLMMFSGINVLLFHLEQFEYPVNNKNNKNNNKNRNYFHHPDFFENNKNSNNNNGEIKNNNNIHPIQKKLIYLWSKKKYSNLILKTRDGGEFKVHREILIWKCNFFHRMIKFGGKESQTMKKDGIILLENINKKLCSNILEFIYTGEIGPLSSLGIKNNNQLKMYILMFCHFEKFQELENMKKVLFKIKNFVEKSKSSESDIYEVITTIGYKFEENENLSKYVIPILTKNKKVNQNQIKNWIGKSEERRSFEIHLSILEEKVKNQDIKLKNQQDQINQLLEFKKKVENILFLKKKK